MGKFSQKILDPTLMRLKGGAPHLTITVRRMLIENELLSFQHPSFRALLRCVSVAHSAFSSSKAAELMQ
jgi:hypothetical protein